MSGPLFIFEKRPDDDTSRELGVGTVLGSSRLVIPGVVEGVTLAPPSDPVLSTSPFPLLESMGGVKEEPSGREEPPVLSWLVSPLDDPYPTHHLG